MKTKPIIQFLSIVFIAICGGIIAHDAQSNRNRGVFIWYIIDTETTNPALRLCTRTTIALYTSNEAAQIPGTPTIVQSYYYSTAVASTACPTLTIWEAL